MKFSENTLKILKNFATFNPSIQFKPGNVLRTISTSESVFAVTQIEDEIPQEACVHDLKKFLAAIELVGDAGDIEFGDNQFTISDGNRSVKYTYASPEGIVLPPQKDIVLPDVDVTFDLRWSDLASTLKAASVLGLTGIAFEGSGGKVYIRAVDPARDNRDNFGICLGGNQGVPDFSMVFSRENIKMIENDYRVSVYSGGVAEFVADKIKYFVAFEAKNSEFGK